MGKKKGSKGKAQGRAGQKQKTRTKQKGLSSSFSSVRVSDVVRASHQLSDDGDENLYGMFQGFVQSSSAAYSPRIFNPNVKLRHQAIAFVPAGTNTPREIESETRVTELEAFKSGDEGRGYGGFKPDAVAKAEVEFENAACPEDDVEESNIHINIIDDASEGPTANMSGGRAATGSPAPSDSSEEIILFHGRNTKPVTPSPAASEHPHVTDDLLAALELPHPSKVANASPPLARGWAARPSKWDTGNKPADEWTPAPPYPYWKKPKAQPDLDSSVPGKLLLDRAPAHQTDFISLEQAKSEPSAEETISELQQDWKDVLREKRLARECDEPVNFLASKSKLPIRRRKRGRRNGHRSVQDVLILDDDDEDEADEAAYDDYMSNLASQLDEGLAAVDAANVGPSMVVDGKKINDDEVLNEELQLNIDNEDGEEDESEDESDDEPVGQDLSDLSEDRASNYSELDSSDLEDELEYTEQEQWEDEADLRRRRMDQMTDEQIARLFAKQSELGIDNDELVIDDGVFASDKAEGIGDVEEARAGLLEIADSAFGRSAKKNGVRRRKNNEFTFPDASALADSVEQYGENGFDIMDYDRPSLRNTKKGRKGDLPPELEVLSDEELKHEMRQTWESDRAKKRMKKAEREELRAEGLLGRKNHNKADLAQKYLQGMTTSQVLEEIKSFLQNDGLESRAFPPMDKKDRKALHELANMLNLKSKSVGSGHSRFPVLYKTSRTVEDIDDRMFDRMLNSDRGFLKNASRANRKGKKTPAKVRPFPSKSAVSLRNGEIVGAGAAEIGKENFGHKLMERMGWSKGMALGKDGEGLLVPVEQVMRAGKAGLG